MGGTMLVSDAELLQWLEEDSGRIAALAAGRPEVAIAACPGWDVNELVGHVGANISGWYTYNLVHEADEHDLQAAMHSAPPLPDGPEERIEYLHHHTRAF